MSRTTGKVQFILFVLLAACAGISVPGNGLHLMPAATKLAQSRLALPPELLYVAGGLPLTRHPFIEVFNAQDTSSSAQPLYTIPPIEGGTYGLFAVDAANDLFAVNYFPNGGKLVVFPSGQTKPSINCFLHNAPQGIYTALHTLYLATASYTIEEYKLPIRRGYTCPKPNVLLTDQYAKLRGTSGVWSPAVDPKGDIFDVWYQNIGNTSEIDVFLAGSKIARHFTGLPEESGYAMLSDLSGNLITNRGSGLHGQSIAVFRHGSHKFKLFLPIRYGAYYGFARGNAGSELFVSKDYYNGEVLAYAYDSKTGTIGRFLRSFASVWRNAQSIAVFSR